MAVNETKFRQEVRKACSAAKVDCVLMETRLDDGLPDAHTTSPKTGVSCWLELKAVESRKNGTFNIPLQISQVQFLFDRAFVTPWVKAAALVLVDSEVAWYFPVYNRKSWLREITHFPFNKDENVHYPGARKYSWPFESRKLVEDLGALFI